ncbi:unnamed protein product [Urochloa decumbens]|uniref:Uncharacterized protein n=1 Tax=Urochloa decumbens TaxID=240449 RepID=A0ABC9D2B5_9POAL
MPAASGGSGGEEDGGLRIASGAGRVTARTRPRGGGEAQMQPREEAAPGAGRLSPGAGRKAPPRNSSRMATKRKLDAIDPAPSPKRMTRASAKIQTHSVPKASEAHKSERRARGHVHIHGETSDVNKIKGKERACDEEDEQVKKQADTDVRKKGSAAKLIKVNRSLIDGQKQVIAGVGFGGLLEIKCMSVPEKLSLWLINKFDTEKSELVFPSRGRIKVDEHAVHRVFGIPMGAKEIDYEKKSGADTFVKFYKVFNHEQDQKAPPFRYPCVI